MWWNDENSPPPKWYDGLLLGTVIALAIGGTWLGMFLLVLLLLRS